MRETTLELIKKFEEDSGVFISATEALTYWSVYARSFSARQKEPTPCTME